MKKQNKSKNNKESKIVIIPNSLGDFLELETQLINLRNNAEKVIEMINWHCK